MAELPSVAEGLARILEAHTAELHTALPAKVVAFDAAKQVATVRPMVRRVRFEGGPDNGERVTEDYPDLPDVPVLFPGGGGMSITWRLDAGSVGLVVVCSDDSSGFYRTGEQSAPDTLRRMGWSGSVFLPIGASIGSLAIPSAAGVVQVNADRLEVGGSSDAAALASRVTTLENRFFLHTHTAPSGETGVANKDPATPYAPGSDALGFASDKLKVGG